MHSMHTCICGLYMILLLPKTITILYSTIERDQVGMGVCRDTRVLVLELAMGSFLLVWQFMFVCTHRVFRCLFCAAEHGAATTQSILYDQHKHTHTLTQTCVAFGGLTETYRSSSWPTIFGWLFSGQNIGAIRDTSNVTLMSKHISIDCICKQTQTHLSMYACDARASFIYLFCPIWTVLGTARMQKCEKKIKQKGQD